MTVGAEASGYSSSFARKTEPLGVAVLRAASAAAAAQEVLAEWARSLEADFRRGPFDVTQPMTGIAPARSAAGSEVPRPNCSGSARCVGRSHAWRVCDCRNRKGAAIRADAG